MAGLPVLRSRGETGTTYHDKPTSFVGKIVGVREHWFTIDQGRALRTELCIDDFYEILDGPAAAMTLLLDAGLNGDIVKITLSPLRLTYDNADQIARLVHVVDAEQAKSAASRS